MDLFFSTLFRYAPNKTRAGELVKFNWESKRVIRKTPIISRTIQFDDPNPRGNSHGGRGVAVIGDRVVVAGYCELQVYDTELNFLYPITHHQMAGLHEVFHESGNRLWIVSTTLNTALLIDICTGEVLQLIWPQEISTFRKHWNLELENIDKNADNRIRFLAADVFKNKSHLHFNAIYVWQGDVYGLFNRFGAVVNLSREKIILEDPAIKGAHNLFINDDGIIFINDTRNQGVNLYGMNGRFIKRINLLPFHKASRIVPWYKITNPIRNVTNRAGLTKQQVVTAFHVRGLDIHNELLFCGISPAALLCLDWKTKKFIGSYDYSDDVRIAVHGLKFAQDANA